MSIRSAVGFSVPGGWKGRYVHSDGDPVGRGPDLWEIVVRDGRERTLTVLTHDHFGWSSICHDQPDITGAEPNRDAPYPSPEYFAWLLGPEGINGDGRYQVVPGYGVAYTTAWRESQLIDWETSETSDPVFIEWVWLLDPDGLYVLRGWPEDGPHGFRLAGKFPWEVDVDAQDFGDMQREVESALVAEATIGKHLRGERP